MYVQVVVLGKASQSSLGEQLRIKYELPACISALLTLKAKKCRTVKRLQLRKIYVLVGP